MSERVGCEDLVVLFNMTICRRCVVGGWHTPATELGMLVIELNELDRRADRLSIRFSIQRGTNGALHFSWKAFRS